MRIPSLKTRRKKAVKSRKWRNNRRRNLRRLGAVEALEERCMLSTVTYDTNSDTLTFNDENATAVTVKTIADNTVEMDVTGDTISFTGPSNGITLDGTQASGPLSLTNGSLTISAVAGGQADGATGNSTDVVIMDDSTAGASYNSDTNTLTVTVDITGGATIQDLVDAINDTSDFTATTSDGAELLDASDAMTATDPHSKTYTDPLAGGSDPHSLTIDTTQAPLDQFNININNSSDSLTFGLADATNGVTNVAITGPSGGTGTATLNTATITGDLTVTAGEVQFGGTVTSSGAGNTVTIISGGAIKDDNAGDPDIVADKIILTAVTGIGKTTDANPTLEIDATQLDVNNTGSGGVSIADTAGGLTLTDFDSSNGSGAATINGTGEITAAGPLVIAQNVTHDANFTYWAGNGTSASDDDLTINNGAVVTLTTAAKLTFKAADDIILDSGSIKAESGEVVLKASLDSAEILTSNIMLQAGGSPATAETLLTSLDGSPFAEGDVIKIDGTNADGDDLAAPVLLNVTAGTKVQDLLDTIDNALTGNNGVNVAIDADGLIRVTTTAGSDVDPDLALKISIQHEPIGSFTKTQDGDSGAGVPEVLTSNTTLQAGGTSATGVTLLTSLYGSPFAEGDVIKIDGTDSDGNEIAPLTLGVTDTTTVQDLLGKIETALKGTNGVEVAIAGGVISVTTTAHSDVDPDLALKISIENDLGGFAVTHQGNSGSVKQERQPEILTADSPLLKKDGTPATFRTLLTDLKTEAGDSPFQVGDAIDINGTNADGTALIVTLQLKVGAETCVQHLLNIIDKALTGDKGVNVAIAADGRITVTTTSTGDVAPDDLALRISVDGGATAPIGLFTVTQQGVGEDASVDTNQLTIKGADIDLKTKVAGLLNATSTNGNIVLENEGDLSLGALDAGAGIIQIISSGAIKDGVSNPDDDTAPNLTAAGGADLTTTGGVGDGSAGNAGIGESDNGGSYKPIRTAIGWLSATTSDGSIYIKDSHATGIIVDNVLAKEDGLTPNAGGKDGDKILLYDFNFTLNGEGDANVKFSDLPPDAAAGNFDISITAESNVLVNTVTAPDEVTITSNSGSILDLNQAEQNILGRKVTLKATGATGMIGQVMDPIEASNPLELTAEEFSATTTNGDIALAEQLVGTAVSVDAGGAGSDVLVTGNGSKLTIGEIKATAGVDNERSHVTVTNGAGKLLPDANSTGSNVVGDVVNLTGKAGIGKKTDTETIFLNTKATELSATATNPPLGGDKSAAIYVENDGRLDAVGAKTNDGVVNITYKDDADGTALNFNPTTEELSVQSATAVTFSNVGGNVNLAKIDAGSHDVSISAYGQISGDDDVSPHVIAHKLTLISGAEPDPGISPASVVGNTELTPGIGKREFVNGDAVIHPINTQVDELDATTSTGDIYIREADRLKLNASSNGFSKTETAEEVGTSNIDVQVEDGRINVGLVSALGNVTLTANGNGSIWDDNDTPDLDIVADTVVLEALFGVGEVGVNGMFSNTLEMSVNTLESVKVGSEYNQLPGDVALSNDKALDVKSVTSPLTGGSEGEPGYVSITANGDLKLGTVGSDDHPFQSVSLTAKGDLIDANDPDTVDPVNDTISVVGNVWSNGDAVLYENGGGDNIGGLISGGIYYVIPDDGGKIKLASSKDNAEAGMAIDLTSRGSGHNHKFSSLQPLSVIAIDPVTTNIYAGDITLNGATIGQAAIPGDATSFLDKIETKNAESITATTTTGGIYLSNEPIAPDTPLPDLTLNATATGRRADIDVDTGGNIVLVQAVAEGDEVKLRAGGSITDSDDDDQDQEPKVNIKARTLNIAALQGIGESGHELEVEVVQVLKQDGGEPGTFVFNSGPLAIDQNALTATGSGTLTFQAGSITILDITTDDNLATIAPGRALELKTRSGNIVFLDPSDTIQTQGTSITIDARSSADRNEDGKPDHDAVAVLGNLATGGGDIMVTADRNITIGELNAGKGANPAPIGSFTKTQNGDSDTGKTEILTGDTPLTKGGGDPATAETLLTDLDGSPFALSDVVKIAGTDADGNEIAPATLSVTDATTVQDLLDAIDLALTGAKEVNVEIDALGVIRVATIAPGDVNPDLALAISTQGGNVTVKSDAGIIVDGNGAADPAPIGSFTKVQNGDSDTGKTEILTGDTALTKVGGDPATGETLLTDLDGSPFALHYVINIDGIDADGADIAPSTLSVTAETRVQDLLDAIDTALNGTTGVDVAIANGLISVTTTAAGDVDPDLALEISTQGGNNVIAASATLKGNAPTARQAELNEEKMIAAAAAASAEAAAKQSSADAFGSGRVIVTTAEENAVQALSGAYAAQFQAHNEAEAAKQAVIGLESTSKVLEAASVAAGIVQLLTEVVDDTADEFPLIGSLGSSVVNGIAVLTASGLGIAAAAVDSGLTAANFDFGSKAGTENEKNAEVMAAQGTLDQATKTRQAFDESFSIAEAAAAKAVDASAAAAVVSNQAIAARDQFHVLGTSPSARFGMDVTGVVNIVAGPTDVFLETTKTSKVDQINSTGNVDLKSAGPILDTDIVAAPAPDPADILATGLTIEAVGGIGTTLNSLETRVATLNATNRSSGGIAIANTVDAQGALDITGILNEGHGDVVISNTGDTGTDQGITISGPIVSPNSPDDPTLNGVSVTSGSPLTVDANVTAGGAIELEASDTPHAGDDLTVNSGVYVQSTNSSVTLRAGDNIVISSGATIQASDTIDLEAGGDVTVNGTLEAPVVIVGGTTIANNTVTLSPSTADTTIDAGAGNNDVLNFNADGLPVTIKGNQIMTEGRGTVTFRNFEFVNILNADGGGSIKLLLENNVAADLVLTGTDQGAGEFQLTGDIPFTFTGVTSFTFVASDQDDTITVSPFATTLLPWDVAVEIFGKQGTDRITYNNVAGLFDSTSAEGIFDNTSVTAIDVGKGHIDSPGVSSALNGQVVLFDSVEKIIANADPGRDDDGNPNPSEFEHLTVNLRNTAAPDAAILFDPTADTDLQLLKGDGTTLFDLDIDTTNYAGLTLNGRGGDNAFSIAPGPIPVLVDGSDPNSNDRLVVKDEGAGDLVLLRQSADQRSGRVSVGELADVVYQGVERLDISPLDPITGGTGDGDGRIVVFHPDPFEFNDSLPNATQLTRLSQNSTSPTIDQGGIPTPFPVNGDEDWYEFQPTATGTFQIKILFDKIPTLANGNPGLPGDGDLSLDIYDANGDLITSGVADANGNNRTATFAATNDPALPQYNRIFVRVKGAGQQPTVSINRYDFANASGVGSGIPGVTVVDNLGPQVTGVIIADAPAYNIFAPKPSDGPTPLVPSMVVHIVDDPSRAPGDPYPAIDPALFSGAPGQQPAMGLFSVVGDRVGNVPIQDVVLTNDPVVDGQVATATVKIIFDLSSPTFAGGLPDDRYTLTVRDGLTDPAGNRLDGESNAAQPTGMPTLPSGNGQAEGDFSARFTVDSRPEIGTFGSGSSFLDLNGNGTFDPQGSGDAVHHDNSFTFGVATDALFAGNFAAAGAGTANGFDKLGAYGKVNGAYRFLLDLNGDGVPDLTTVPTLQINGVPVAGDFDTNHPGDEVGLFSNGTWYLDTNGDNNITSADLTVKNGMHGLPVAGDFDGDTNVDLATYDPSSNTFFFDLASNGYGLEDATINFGFPDGRERPVAADMNGDGVTDIGLFVPRSEDSSETLPADWYFLVSEGTPIPGSVSTLNHTFNQTPFSNDLYFTFGASFYSPIVGNFDPPVAETSNTNSPTDAFTNPSNRYDVNNNGVVNFGDLLTLIGDLRVNGSHSALISSIPSAFLDVDGSQSIDFLDILEVIGFMRNGGAAEGEAAAEGDAASRSPLLSPSLAAPGVSQPSPLAADQLYASSVDQPSGGKNFLDSAIVSPEGVPVAPSLGQTLSDSGGAALSPSGPRTTAVDSLALSAMVGTQQSTNVDEPDAGLSSGKYAVPLNPATVLPERIGPTNGAARRSLLDESADFTLRDEESFDPDPVFADYNSLLDELFGFID